MKLVKKLCILAAACVLGGAVVSCKKSNPVGTLDIFCMEAGYGYEWCEEMIEAFKNEQWVQEKYPNLQVNFQHNDNKTFLLSKLKAGAKNNTFDLLFGELPQTSIDDTYLADLTNIVYKKTIPGESVTYEEKAFDSYNKTNAYVDPAGVADDKYYVCSWAGGMNGIFYNEDLLNALEIDVPRTTDELIAICEQVLTINNATYNKKYSFIQSKGLGYLSYLFPIWWAQYEGMDGYDNYYNGIDDGALSKNIFNQKGRLYSLEVFEDLFFYDDTNAYLNPASQTYDFMTAQSMFLKGYGLFHVNGDWYENEMSSMKADIKKEDGIEYSIKLMRTPIVSALGTKLGITDTELAAIVDYVDGVTTTIPTFTPTNAEYDADAVIEAVREARGIVNASGPYHTAVIPNYAQDQDIAADFLLFMASDKGLETYIEATNGASLAFEYDLKTKNPELYAKITPMQRERIDYFNSKTINVQVLPCKENYALVKYGGLSEFTTSNFTTYFSYADNYDKTLPKYTLSLNIYNKTISDWNDKKWNDSLDKAGLK